MMVRCLFFFFFFNDTATTEIYTLSLHDALPIYAGRIGGPAAGGDTVEAKREGVGHDGAHLVDRDAQLLGDRKSTRLNSSHLVISYAVFCLKKKKAIPVLRVTFSAGHIVCVHDTR